MWGCYSRRFWAFCLFSADPAHRVLSAAQPTALSQQVHRVQQYYRLARVRAGIASLPGDPLPPLPDPPAETHGHGQS